MQFSFHKCQASWMWRTDELHQGLWWVRCLWW